MRTVRNVSRQSVHVGEQLHWLSEWGLQWRTMKWSCIRATCTAHVEGHQTKTGSRALLHALHHYALWACADFNLAVSTPTTKLPNLIFQPLHALYVLWAWADFNLAVSTPTTKLPNLIPGQILRLYGIYSTLLEHYRIILPVAPWTLCTLRV